MAKTGLMVALLLIFHMEISLRRVDCVTVDMIMAQSYTRQVQNYSVTG